MTTQNEAAERLRHLIERWVPPSVVNSMKAAADAALYVERDQALAAERRDFGKRVLANFSDRIDRAWGNENAAKATDLLRWAVDEEAAR